MKKLSKKLLAVLLVITMLIPTGAMMFISGAVEDTSVGIPGYVQNTSGEKAKGSCTDTISWVLYNDGEFVVTGSGKMPDWSYAQKVQWWPYHEYIKKVTIGNGITYIGVSSFDKNTNLESVIIPKSVVKIAGFAFWYCDKLETVYYTGTEAQWNSMYIEIWNTGLTNAELFCEWSPSVEQKQFPDGYDFETDGWSFHNFRRSSTEEQFKRLFKPSKAHLLYLKEGNYGMGGNCYGMALTTIALMNQCPSADSFFSYDGITNINIADINRHDTNESLDDFFIIRDEEISADGNRYYHSYAVSEYINYGLLTWLASETIENDRYNCVAVYNAVKEYVNGERSYPPIIVIAKNKDGANCHAVLGVGIEDNKIIINDSNNENTKCYLELKKTDNEFTGEWSYLGYSGNTTDEYGLIEWVDGSTYSFPYTALYNDLYLDTNRDLSKGEEIERRIQQMSNDKQLFYSNTDKYIMDYKGLTRKDIFPQNSDILDEDYGYLYWVDDSDVNTLTFSDIKDDNAEFILSDNYSAVYATVSNCRELSLTADDDSKNSTIITTNSNTPVKVSFVATDNNYNCITLTITGTASGDEVTATETDNGIQVTGLNNITVTYETADGTGTTTANITDGRTMNIVFDDASNSVDFDWNCSHLCHSENGFMQFIWKIVKFIFRIFGTNQYCDCGMAHW